MTHSSVALFPGSVDTDRRRSISRPDYSACARSLISEGHCRVGISPYLKENFWRLVGGYAEISQEIKDTFSFPDRTDGFLPFGMERSRSTNRVDLCERFCYRQKYRLVHHRHPFSSSAWYDAAVQCEAYLSALAERILDAIRAEFDASDNLTVRDSSYLQFCSYDMRYRCDGREYLQDRHEDGNLITLVMASREGLILFPDGLPRAAAVSDDEVIVFTGSLLTTLSDGRIPPMDHAVLSPPEKASRSSLAYFAVPDLQRTYTSYVGRKRLNLEEMANELHQGFGNRPFADPPLSAVD